MNIYRTPQTELRCIQTGEVTEMTRRLTLSKEPLESPRPASPARSSRMSMRPSLLRSSWSKSSAQRFSLSWSWQGGSLSWHCTNGNQVRWGPMTGHLSLTQTRHLRHKMVIHIYMIIILWWNTWGHNGCNYCNRNLKKLFFAKFLLLGS